MTGPPTPAARIATYRWQLTPEHGFAAAAAAVDDLAAVGVSHLYLSPIAEAVPGSTHGYDAVDPTRVRAALGGDDGLADLAARARAAGLALLLDIVPNHLAAHPANPWWWDVLRLGRRSRWAEAFDVDWDPPKRALAETVLLPVLGDHYGRELEAGTLRLARSEQPGPGRIVVLRYHDLELPISPRSTAALLAAAAHRVGDDVLGVAARLLARVEDADAEPDPDARDADLLVAERTALARLAADPAVTSALDDELAAVDADPDRLDAVLAEQHHRVARWQVGSAEVGYRRFFDVTSLVATRVERPAVFDLLHRLPLALVADGTVDGLRIDHVDGLRDPQGYLDRLRRRTGPDAWLLVEKILRTGPDGTSEDLPASWPVAGTTGYEVADLLGAWLTDPAGAAVLVDGWRDRTGVEADRIFADVALDARREVVLGGLAADVERVVDGLVRVCEARRRHRDHTRTALRDAVVALAVHAPAYRSYVRVPGGASPADEAFVETAITGAGAGAGSPEIDPELLDLLRDVLLGRLTGPDEAEVALRFQQLTGPVAAKGEEDTALYRWLALPHRCEVGADPGRPALDGHAWHEACAEAQRRWPERLTSLATHDTKRSADVRARLAALTTVPDEALAAFDRWWPAPDGLDPATGWLVFHTLVGAHPLPFDRAWTVIEKSVREAEVRTSWTAPDEAYESALRAFVEAACADAGAADGVVAGLVEQVGAAGDAAALAQLAAQLLAPGVPDVYQGGEGWDRSLVDPDNRRPVDPAWRRSMLDSADRTDPAAAWADPVTRATGLPRLLVLRAGLGLRRRHPLAFGPGPAGAYLPLTAAGPDAARVLAFGRGDPAAAVVVVARPGPGATVTTDAAVALPPGDWTDVLTGATHVGGRSADTAVADLHASFPVALLERQPG